MRSIAAIFLTCAALLGSLPPSSRTATTAERQACEAPILQELAQTQARLRKAHGAGTAAILRERLRVLQERRYACRNYPPG